MKFNMLGPFQQRVIVDEHKTLGWSKFLQRSSLLVFSGLCKQCHLHRWQKSSFGSRTGRNRGTRERARSP